MARFLLTLQNTGVSLPDYLTYSPNDSSFVTLLES